MFLGLATSKRAVFQQGSVLTCMRQTCSGSARAKPRRRLCWALARAHCLPRAPSHTPHGAHPRAAPVGRGERGTLARGLHAAHACKVAHLARALKAMEPLSAQAPGQASLWTPAEAPANLVINGAPRKPGSTAEQRLHGKYINPLLLLLLHIKSQNSTHSSPKHKINHHRR